MAIHGLDENITLEQLNAEVLQGAKFVTYTYVISILIMTCRVPTDIRFIQPTESRIRAGLAYTLLSLIVGWWGIPWGPVYTILSVWRNLRGGTDVTEKIMFTLLGNREKPTTLAAAERQYSA